MTAGNLDIYKNFDQDLPLAVNVSVDGAAGAYKLDPSEIEWAIEEYGRFDTVDENNNTITLVMTGDPAPSKLVDEA